MNRRGKILLALLIPTVIAAAWQWGRPYEWRPDPAAGAEIRQTSLERDHGYHWLGVRLEVTDPETFEIPRNLALVLDDGREIPPAELQLEGGGEAKPTPDGPRLERTTGLALKFWLEPGDLAGPVDLRVGDGRLTVRTGAGTRPLDNGERTVFRDTRW